MTHCTYRSRVRAGHQTVTGPVTPTCSWDRWGRAETQRTALGEALIVLRRTRVRFPPPPPRGVGEMPAHCWRKAGATADSGGPGFSLSTGTLWPPRRVPGGADTPPLPCTTGLSCRPGATRVRGTSIGGLEAPRGSAFWSAGSVGVGCHQRRSCSKGARDLLGFGVLTR